MPPGQDVALVCHADRVALRSRQPDHFLASQGFHQPWHAIPRIAGAVAELSVAVCTPAEDRAPLCDHRGVPIGRRDQHSRAHLTHAARRGLRVHARVPELAIPVRAPSEDQATLADRRGVVLGGGHRKHTAAGREARPYAAGRDHRNLPAVHVELGVAEAPSATVPPSPQAPAVQCATVELPPRDGCHRAAPEALDPHGRLLHALGARSQLKVRPVAPSHNLPAQPRRAPAEKRPELFPEQVQGGPTLGIGRLSTRATRQELARERQAAEEEGAVQGRPPALRAPLSERLSRRARPQGREQGARPLGGRPAAPPPRSLPQRPSRGPEPQRPGPRARPRPAPAPRPAHPRGERSPRERRGPAPAPGGRDDAFLSPGPALPGSELFAVSACALPRAALAPATGVRRPCPGRAALPGSELFAVGVRTTPGSPGSGDRRSPALPRERAGTGLRGECGRSAASRRGASARGGGARACAAGLRAGALRGRGPAARSGAGPLGPFQNFQGISSGISCNLSVLNRPEKCDIAISSFFGDKFQKKT